MKNASIDCITKFVTKNLPQAPKIVPKTSNLAAKIAKHRQKCREKLIFAASIFRAKKGSEKTSKKSPSKTEPDLAGERKAQ